MHGATGLTRNVNTNEADLSAAKQPTSLAKIKHRHLSSQRTSRSLVWKIQQEGTRLVGSAGLFVEGARGVIISFRRVDG